jgi:transcription termination factor Rho
VLLVDTLDGVPLAAARRALAAARAIVDGGSLTIIATATEPIGGETTVIGPDATRTAARNFPALDLTASGTLCRELLVGSDQLPDADRGGAPTRPSHIRVAAGSRRCAR